MGRTIVQRLVGDVRVVVRTARSPAADDLEDHVREALTMSDRTRAVLVAVVGDGADYQFDFELRAKLSQADLFAVPLALLAPPIRPELVLSLKWVGAEVHSFGPDAFDEACDSLAIAPSMRPELRETLAALKDEIS